MTSAQSLLSAAEAGDERAVEKLLDAGADVDAATPGGETALMRAASRGHAAVVRALVVSGADVNAARADGWTALMLASFFGHAESVRALVAAGADVSAADRNGSDAFSWAASRGHVEVAKLLKTNAPARAAVAASTTSRATREARRDEAPTAPRPTPAARAIISEDESRAEPRVGEVVRARRAEAESLEKVFGGATKSAAASAVVEDAAPRASTRDEDLRAEAPLVETRAVESRGESRADEPRETEFVKRMPARRGRAYAYAAALAFLVAAGGAVAYRYAGLSRRGVAPASQAPAQTQAVAPDAPPAGATAVEPLQPAPSAESSVPAAASTVGPAPETFAPAVTQGEAFTPTTPVEEPVRNVRGRGAAYAVRDAGVTPQGVEPSLVESDAGDAGEEARREAARRAAEQQQRRQQQQPARVESSTEDDMIGRRREVVGPQRQGPPPAPAPTPKRAREIPWPPP